MLDTESKDFFIENLRGLFVVEKVKTQIVLVKIKEDPLVIIPE